VKTKSHYELLQVAPTASADEIKRAFRLQIARYHPDKVEHLGKEFRDMAADRATDLTEAYRVLSDDAERAKYDRMLGGGAASPPSQPAAAAGTPPTGPESPTPPQAGTPRPRTTYTKERASRDHLVRKVTVQRIRKALALAGTDYNETPIRGFDIALVPKPKMFGAELPRLLARFIEPVDAAAVADAWSLAMKAVPSVKDTVCVLLLGSSLAPQRELAQAIAEQRRANRAARVTLIPIDVRTWDAHMPLDAPVVCRDLLTRLKAGN
jgi:hypothetical protein